MSYVRTRISTIHNNVPYDVGWKHAIKLHFSGWVCSYSYSYYVLLEYSLPQPTLRCKSSGCVPSYPVRIVWGLTSTPKKLHDFYMYGTVRYSTIPHITGTVPYRTGMLVWRVNGTVRNDTVMCNVANLIYSSGFFAHGLSPVPPLRHH